MPVNDTVATFSDYAFRSAVAVYLFAMVMHLGEYARTRHIPNPAAPARVKVAAGARTATGDTTTHEGSVADLPYNPGSTPRPRTERFGRTAVALTVLGAGVHIASVVLRGIAVQRWPWGNMYEFISAICLMAVLGWLVMLRKTLTLRPAGVFVLLPVEILLFLAGTSLYVQAAPVMPALQTYWLSIHVTAVSVSSGLLMVSGVASVLYLIRRHLKPGRFIATLPTAESLDRVAYRITVFAFPLYTFAIMAGAIWAEAAWGKFWGWDPKETVAFVVWVLYACYLHARATAGWRTSGAAWINTAGFVAVLFNLFFVNLVTVGLHSYAGMN